jgi:hypothetical protein
MNESKNCSESTCVVIEYLLKVGISVAMVSGRLS